MPENAEFKGYTINYPLLLKSKPNSYTKNFILWHGVVPQKDQSVVFNLTYHYATSKNKLILPIGNVGVFKFKNTYTNIRIIINDKLRNYDSNYSFNANVKDLKTFLNFSQELDKNGKNLILTW